MNFEIEVSNYNLGAAAFKNEKYERSVHYYTQAIKDNSWISFSDAYLWRGMAYYFLRNYENAIRDLNEASLGRLNEIRIYNWRGLSYKAMSQYQQAVDDFKKAIEIEVEFREAYVELYEIGFLVGDLVLSEEYFTKLASFGGTSVGLLISRANDNSDANKYELAIEMCDFMLRKIVNEINSLQIRGTSHAQLLNYGLALSDFNKVIELNPRHATGYYNRAILLRELNRDGSNQDFLKAYELGMTIAKNYIIG